MKINRPILFLPFLCCLSNTATAAAKVQVIYEKPVTTEDAAIEKN
jgi:hypothetical protein